MSFKRVLIAVDDSKYSKEAAKIGIKMARNLSADVAMIYVIEPISTFGNLDSPIIPDNLEQQEIDEGKELLNLYQNEFAAGLYIEKMISVGDPAHEILKAAKDWDARLIVIGRHGLESFKHLVFGGVVDYVATHTNIPVLLIPFQE
jgi:nucleotide-binding universal stress UspA family protein